ncbi:MAG: putative sugar kinase YdjH [Phycisphaerales bacterium]|nr:putative sugar kinase YdjH [Phycisphaerales bacterium]
MAGILVVGIAVVDAIARPVDAMPAPGGLRFFDDLTMTTGGCAVNCAIALSRIGVACDIVARVGRDPLGDFVVSELERGGVSTRHIVRDADRSTSFSFVAVPANGERAFLHTTGANATLAPADVPASLLSNTRLVFVAGTMLMDSLDGTPTAELLAGARAAGARTMLDTVYVEGRTRDQWRRRVEPALERLDYFVPSRAEAAALAGTDDVRDAAAMFRDAGARNVVIKLGAEGAACLDEHGSYTLVRAFRADRVVDATGAGDCWSAGFLAGLEQGLAPVNAVRLGNAVACVSVQSAGATTGIRSMEQVMQVMRAGG